jgi:hypothetical protein
MDQPHFKVKLIILCTTFYCIERNTHQLVSVAL